MLATQIAYQQCANYKQLLLECLSRHQEEHTNNTRELYSIHALAVGQNSH